MTFRDFGEEIASFTLPLEYGYLLILLHLCFRPYYFLSMTDTYENDKGVLVSICHMTVESELGQMIILVYHAIFNIFPLTILFLIYFIILYNLTLKYKQSYVCYKSIKYPTMYLLFIICYLTLRYIPYRFITIWILIKPIDSIFYFRLSNYANLLYAGRLMISLAAAINPVLYLI